MDKRWQQLFRVATAPVGSRLDTFTTLTAAREYARLSGGYVRPLAHGRGYTIVRRAQ
jgi:hypothetical protein